MTSRPNLKIVINAISIVEGGGFVVLNHLLNAMSEMSPGIVWYVAAEPQVLARLPKSDAIVGLPYTWVKKSPLHHLYWYEFELPKIIKKLKADLCFSQTNFLPRRELTCPTLLLVQHAGYYSEKFKQYYSQWNKKLLNKIVWEQKNQWVHNSVQRATQVTVQTKALADQIVTQSQVSRNKMIVVPHGSGLLTQQIAEPLRPPANKTWRIGYITKFGVQKNFEVALKGMQLLKDSGVDAKFILTLGEDSAEFANLKTMIDAFGLQSQIENHGEVSDPKRLQELYKSLHIFMFPSWCESFGFTLVEAMKAGLPVVVADTPSNREVAKLAGEFFETDNPQQLASKMRDLMHEDKVYEAASERSLTQSKEYCWQKTAKSLLDIIHNTVRNPI